MKCFTLWPRIDHFEIWKRIDFDEKITHEKQEYWAIEVRGSLYQQKRGKFIILDPLFEKKLHITTKDGESYIPVKNILFRNHNEKPVSKEIIQVINDATTFEHLYWIIYCPVIFNYFKIKVIRGDCDYRTSGILKIKTNSIVSLIHGNKKFYLIRNDIEDTPFLSESPDLGY
jgi:hypothetical protein